MSKIRIGILGATRGLNFALYSLFQHPYAEVAAICESSGPLLKRVDEQLSQKGLHPVYCTDYDSMLNMGIDAVILANFANKHAEYAIRALNHGIHVLSEVLPTQTPSEAVRLCEACEKSGRIYQYAENYCFTDQTLEMKRRYEQGDIGELVSAECDFINDCSGRWNLLTRGLRNHWRNYVPSTFYCTHSIGPMLYTAGLRPKNVTGMETPLLDYMKMHGARSGSAAIELMQLENGAFAKSVNGNLKYPYLSRLRLIGTKGGMEHRLGALQVHLENGRQAEFDSQEYVPESPYAKERVKEIRAPLDRGTVFVLEFFLGSILGDKEAAKMGIDVYRALDMSLPGLFAYRSILRESAPMRVPDFRNREEREQFRHDSGCTDPETAGDQLLPSCSSSREEIPDEVYRKEAELYEYNQKTTFHLGFN